MDLPVSVALWIAVGEPAGWGDGIGTTPQWVLLINGIKTPMWGRPQSIIAQLKEGLGLAEEDAQDLMDEAIGEWRARDPHQPWTPGAEG